MTPAQRDLRDFIVDYQNANGGVTPSYDEMRLHMGLASRSGVHRMVCTMEREGVLKRGHGAVRDIRVIDPNALGAFACLGTEVFSNGFHYCEAADESAARFIAAALNAHAQLHSRNALSRAA